MLPATRDWLEGLRDSADENLRRTSPDSRVADDQAAAAERAILAAHLATWLDATPVLLECRRSFARNAMGPADPEPAIVITTSAAGIMTTRDFLGRDDPLAGQIRARAAVVTEKEYRRWCMAHPDERHHLHVNHWSWIKTRIPPRRHAEFARHPLRPGEEYWLHRVGTAGGGNADGRSAHLWKFDGRHASLLEPFVAETGLTPPRA